MSYKDEIDKVRKKMTDDFMDDLENERFENYTEGQLYSIVDSFQESIIEFSKEVHKPDSQILVDAIASHAKICKNIVKYLGKLRREELMYELR